MRKRSGNAGSGAFSAIIHAMPRSNKAPRPTPRPAGDLTTRLINHAWIVLALLAVLAYLNGLQGAFVYDDTRQITQNLLIQDPASWGRALTSDVWAFKGTVEQAFSNYWRPTFVAWLILNVRAFGLGNTLPWHLANLLAHIAITLTAFSWLKTLRLDPRLAAGIAAIFALHPAHVETVTWISGSPDLLMAWPLLGAVWLTQHTAAAPAGRWWRYALALLCGAVAMLAKEAAIVLPLLIFVVLMVDGNAAPQTRWRAALQWSAPFVIVAGAYFMARLQILGQVTRENYGHTGPIELILSAPALLTFYLRQTFLPVWIGPNYPLRPVTLANLGFENFFGPLIVIGIVTLLGIKIARQKPIAQIGLALFLLPLAPAFNIIAFIPEHTVHDRYLYLPLLGAWMVALPALAEAWGAWRRVSVSSAATTGLIAALALSAPYALQTWRYNTAWQNELALWEWAIQSDPTSAFNWSLYAKQLYEAGRMTEAKAALEKALVSLTVSSAPDSLVLRAQIATDEKRYSAAIADLHTVIAGQPTNVTAYEQLAVVYQQHGDLNAALQVLVQGRQTNPANDCELSTNIAVLYYLGNAKPQAQIELERIRPLTASDFSPICRQALFYLGELYLEQGRGPEAQALYSAYLQLTATFTDKTTLRYRQLAQQRLGP
jgi:Flp pilus assembly protein TadD